MSSIRAFEMKKYLLMPAAMLVSSCLPLTVAQAADSTIITIKANIVASPCTVDTTQLDIDLGEIQADTLAVAGATSPWSSPSQIHLSHCPATTQGVQATFSGTPATNGDANGYKNVGAGGDASISVQLQGANSTYLSNGHKTGFMLVTNNSVDFPVQARLYTSAAANPGLVAATVTVTFEYE